MSVLPRREWVRIDVLQIGDRVHLPGFWRHGRVIETAAPGRMARVRLQPGFKTLALGRGLVQRYCR